MFTIYSGADMVEVLTNELTTDKPDQYTKSTVEIDYVSILSQWCETEDGEWYYCGEGISPIRRLVIIGASIGVAAIGLGVALFFILRSR